MTRALLAIPSNAIDPAALGTIRVISYVLYYLSPQDAYGESVNRMANRYGPFEEMNRMFEQMRNAFWDYDGAFPHGQDTDRRLPAGGAYRRSNVDLAEHDGEYVLSADLPGFEKEEITLSYDEGFLTIQAEHALEGETTARSRRVFERVTIPKMVEEDGISATYRNGVLQIHMPIVGDEGETGHTIEIED